MRLTGTVLIATILHLAILPGALQSKPLFDGSHEILPTGYQPVSVVTADFNRDGHLDIAVAVMNADAIVIRPGNSNGEFGPGIRIPSL